VLKAPIDLKALAKATSLHVFAFTGDRQLLLAESEGDFGVDVWEEAAEVAEGVCCAGTTDEAGRDEDVGEGMELYDDDEEEGGVRLDGGGPALGQAQAQAQTRDGGLSGWLKSVVQEKVRQESRWTAVQ